MTGRVRILVLVGVTIGVLAAVIVAAAVPRTRTHVTPAAVTLAAVNPERTAAATPQPKGAGYILLRARAGSVRLEARTPDPRGGPPWALRVFEAERVVGKAARRPGVNPVIGRNLCAQLGRVYRGTFGWIDAKATFRPAGIGFRGAPTRCGSRRPDMGGKPLIGLETLISDPASPSPGVYRTVLWGIAGRAARSLQVRMHERSVRLPASARGGFIVLGDASLHENQVSVRLGYASGASRRLELGAARTPLPAFLRQRMQTRPAGPARIEARAADPNGGLPWGVSAAPSSDGGWCVSTSAARIVGDRVGHVDGALGLLRENVLRPYDCPGNRGPLSRQRPVSFAGAFGAGDDRRGPQRRARRTLPRSTVLSGVTRADVTAITIATPRDVRTLLPSLRAHAFVAVYDGTFPTGQLVITATFRDGTSVVQRFPAGF